MALPPYPMSHTLSLIASPSVDPNLSVSEREGDAALCLARAIETGSLVVSFWAMPKRLPEGEESQAITLDEQARHRADPLGEALLSADKDRHGHPVG